MLADSIFEREGGAGNGQVRKAVAGRIRYLKKERELVGHQGCVNTCYFSDDCTTLLSGSDDQRIILWDWGNGTLELGCVLFKRIFSPCS